MLLRKQLISGNVQTPIIWLVTAVAAKGERTSGNVAEVRERAVEAVRDWYYERGKGRERRSLRERQNKGTGPLRS